MRKLVAVLFLCLPSCLLAQDFKKKTTFEKDLKFINFAIENFNHKDFYKDYEFKHNKTGNVKKLEDFTALERNVFYTLQAERLTKNLKRIQAEWEEYLKKLETDDIDDDDVAKEEDVKSYIEKLNDLRKKLAAKYESLVEKMFKDFPDDFTDKEKKHIMDKIKRFHNENSLTKRG
ncbi:MAG: hypothetical protein GTO02_02680 [Candidatus Dadabacteria bacterium]|nr:hypothetical protein [Candidatus Dadabacteria bacterium]